MFRMNSYCKLCALIFICGLQAAIGSRLLVDLPDYCREDFRCGRLIHLMCQYQWKRESNICGKIWIETDQWLRRDMFNRVNSFRQVLAGGGIPMFPGGASNMRQVSWSYELEKMAEAWTLKYIDRLLAGNDFTTPCTKTKEFRDGTTILGYILGPDEMARDSLAIWMKKLIPPDIVGNFRPDRANNSETYNDFAALVWAETHKMGCSVATCSRGLLTNPMRVIVCLFGPRGNYPGKTVFKNGTACLDCPSRTKCKAGSFWPKLCAAEEDNDVMDTSDGNKLFPIVEFVAFLLPVTSIILLLVTLTKSNFEDKKVKLRKIGMSDDVPVPSPS